MAFAVLIGQVPFPGPYLEASLLVEREIRAINCKSKLILSSKGGVNLLKVQHLSAVKRIYIINVHGGNVVPRPCKCSIQSYADIPLPAVYRICVSSIIMNHYIEGVVS